MKMSSVMRALLIIAVVIISLPKVNAQTLKPLVHGSQSGPEKGTSLFISIEVKDKVLDLVKTWDKRIWFFTSKDNPLKSFNNLQAKDIAIWGAELMKQTQDLYKVLGITDTTSVRLIGTGNPIFSGMENPPRLFITWSSHESQLNGSIRIELKEKKK